MDVTELQKKAKKDAETDVSFYNPSHDDVVVTYHGKIYSVPALNIATYKKPLADFIKEKILHHICNSKDKDVTPQIREEIYNKMENYARESE